MENKSISIIGCGWLGLSLGRFLVERGYRVKGSTTREEKLPVLQAAGIEPFEIQAGEKLTGDQLDAFFQSDIVILNIPPGRRRPNVETFHPKQVKAVVSKAMEQDVKKLLFISSTGIYGNTGKVMTEADEPQPSSASGRALQTVETYLKSQAQLQVTILRLSGLVGGDRKAGRFLAGKKDVANGGAPVNLIHRDDCISVIYQIIEQGKWGEVFNLSADKHPSRATFYLAQAQKQGFEPPTFREETESSFKIISNHKVKEALGYELLYPDPMLFP